MPPLDDEVGLASFAEGIDRSLKRANHEYEEYRRHDHQIAPPRVHSAPPGTFARWMEKQGKSGGQHKVPRILRDPDRLLQLLSLAGGTR
jgi:hypothetical protein